MSCLEALAGLFGLVVKGKFVLCLWNLDNYLNISSNKKKTYGKGELYFQMNIQGIPG